MGARLMEEILIQMFYNRTPLDIDTICRLIATSQKRPVSILFTEKFIRILLEEGYIKEHYFGWYMITTRNDRRFGLSGMELAREHCENRLFICYMLCKEYGVPSCLSREEKMEFNLRQACFGEFS